MNRLTKILLFTFALALLVPALPAQAAPGRGGHGGGGHSGGGHGGGGGWGRGHGGVGRVFIGGGWGWGYWGWPGYYGYYGPGYGYYGGYGRPYAYGPASNWAVIDTDISPEEAQVYLDGRYIGTADDFDGNPDYLYLKPGRYRIEFRLEGFETLTRQIEARPGSKMDFNDKLHRIAGAKQYGSYERPRQQGEVRRYFGRNRDSVEAIEPSEQPADAQVIAADGDADDDDVQAEPAPAPAPAPRMRRDRDSYGERWRGGDRSRAESRTRLRLNIEPADAAVYVDNRFVGTAEEVNSLERGVSITPGKHTITVSRPGFRDKTTDVTVDQGRTQTLEISLSH